MVAQVFLKPAHHMLIALVTPLKRELLQFFVVLSLIFRYGIKRVLFKWNLGVFFHVYEISHESCLTFSNFTFHQFSFSDFAEFMEFTKQGSCND